MADVVFVVGVVAFPMLLGLGVIGRRFDLPRFAAIIEFPRTPPLLVGMAIISLGWVLDAVPFGVRLEQQRGAAGSCGAAVLSRAERSRRRTR